MEAERRKAYEFLLSAALLHLKWDLCGLSHGTGLWPPWEWSRRARIIAKAKGRAVTFHNLACFSTWEMNGFREEQFWRDIALFERRFPEDWGNYRGMFDRKLAGGEVSVIKPGG